MLMLDWSFQGFLFLFFSILCPSKLKTNSNGVTFSSPFLQDVIAPALLPNMDEQVKESEAKGFSVLLAWRNVACAIFMPSHGCMDFLLVDLNNPCSIRLNPLLEDPAWKDKFLNSSFTEVSLDLSKVSKNFSKWSSIDTSHHKTNRHTNKKYKNHWSIWFFYTVLCSCNQVIAGQWHLSRTGFSFLNIFCQCHFETLFVDLKQIHGAGKFNTFQRDLHPYCFSVGCPGYATAAKIYLTASIMHLNHASTSWSAESLSRLWHNVWTYHLSIGHATREKTTFLK